MGHVEQTIDLARGTGLGELIVDGPFTDGCRLAFGKRFRAEMLGSMTNRVLDGGRAVKQGEKHVLGDADTIESRIQRVLNTVANFLSIFLEREPQVVAEAGGDVGDFDGAVMRNHGCHTPMALRTRCHAW